MATTHRDPSWWKADYDSSWDRVKDALRRDWEQTKHDVAGKGRDLDQDAGDTVKQAMGKQSPPERFDAHERSLRYGYGARQHYGKRYGAWNDDVERELKGDFGTEWDRERDYVRRGWDYER